MAEHNSQDDVITLLQDLALPSAFLTTTELHSTVKAAQIIHDLTDDLFREAISNNIDQPIAYVYMSDGWGARIMRKLKGNIAGKSFTRYHPMI